ncbi:MAG: hypothetical protein ACOYOQ_00055 [Microthrixaceae bacterium]
MTKVRYRPATPIGTRAPADASYEERARLHSEVVETGPYAGCWEWFGHISGGVPRVSRRKPHRGPVNLRVAMLEERGVARPEDTRTASPKCGNDFCVNPDHLIWETKDEFHARISRKQFKVSEDRIRDAWEQRQNGVPVKDIAARLKMARSSLYARWAALGLTGESATPGQ